MPAVSSAKCIFLSFFTILWIQHSYDQNCALKHSKMWILLFQRISFYIVLTVCRRLRHKDTTSAKHNSNCKLKPKAFISIALTKHTTSIFNNWNDSSSIVLQYQIFKIFIYATSPPFQIFSHHQPLKAVFESKEPVSCTIMSWLISVLYNIIVLIFTA
jgi:hypothetical protein